MDSSSTSTNNAATQRAIALADCAPGLEDAQDALLRSLRHEVSELRSGASEPSSEVSGLSYEASGTEFGGVRVEL